MQAVRVHTLTEPLFLFFRLSVACLFCFLFYLLICSPFIPLLALYLIFTRFCDACCELLGMISECVLGKIFMGEQAIMKHFGLGEYAVVYHRFDSDLDSP